MKEELQKQFQYFLQEEAGDDEMIVDCKEEEERDCWKSSPLFDSVSSSSTSLLPNVSSFPRKRAKRLFCYGFVTKVQFGYSMTNDEYWILFSVHATVRPHHYHHGLIFLKEGHIRQGECQVCFFFGYVIFFLLIFF